MEDLPDPVVPLGEGLVLADVAEVEATEGEEVGAVLVAGGEADGADAGAVEDSVGNGGAEEGAEAGVRWINNHLLAMEIYITASTCSERRHTKSNTSSHIPHRFHDPRPPSTLRAAMAKWRLKLQGADTTSLST